MRCVVLARYCSVYNLPHINKRAIYPNRSMLDQDTGGDLEAELLDFGDGDSKLETAQSKIKMEDSTKADPEQTQRISEDQAEPETQQEEPENQQMQSASLLEVLEAQTEQEIQSNNPESLQSIPLEGLAEPEDQTDQQTTTPEELPAPEQQDLDQVPNLAISREQTPDTDFYDDDSQSGYSDLARATPQPEDEPRKRTANVLDPERAVKRTRAELAEPTGLANDNTDPEYDPENPAGVKHEKVRRRVAGKVIDKLWAPLDANLLLSFEKLCQILLGKVLERYHGMASQQTKVEEAQRVIANSWVSARNPRSFATRLQVSKMPPIKSLQVRTKRAAPENVDPLNIDLVLRHKKRSEALLLAELDQLTSLESYYRNLNAMYELDAKYLHDFSKTTSSLRAQHAEEKEAKIAQLHLETTTNFDDIAISNKPTPQLVSSKKFDPNHDDDVRTILESLEAKLAEQNIPMKKLMDLSDQLDSMYSLLNSGVFPRHSES